MKLYVHYKGGMYLHLDTVDDSTNDSPYSDPLVVYYSLDRLVLHTRLHPEFHEKVEWPDGIMRHRFERAMTPSKVVELYQAAGGDA